MPGASVGVVVGWAQLQLSGFRVVRLLTWQPRVSEQGLQKVREGLHHLYDLALKVTE
jgi:hypothetical protein